MSVAKPLDLLVCNESSGTAITNYGTRGTNYTIQQGTENTDWVWHHNTGAYDGYFEGITNGSSSQAYATTTGTPANSLQTLSFASAFRLTAINNAVASLVGRSDDAHGMVVKALLPGGGGDFDLRIEVASGGGLFRTVNYLALTFGTDYTIAACLNTGTSSVTELRAKLGAASVQTSGTQDWTGDTVSASLPRFLYSDSFTNLRGWKGFVYYWAYDRGGTAWSDTDLANINSSPKTTITGWPQAAAASYYLANDNYV